MKRFKKILKKFSTGTIVFALIAVFLFNWSWLQYNMYRNCVDTIGGFSTGGKEELADGDNVCLTGKVKTEKKPVDILTGVSCDGPVLMRNVEMYQYYLSSDTVYKGFVSSQNRNIFGLGGELFENPAFPEELRQEMILGDVVLEDSGIYLGRDFVYNMSIPDYSYFKNAHESEIIDAGEIDIAGYTFTETESGVYETGNVNDHKIGDIRITYTCIPEDSFGDITVMGKYSGGAVTADDCEFASMTDYAAGRDGMIELIGHDSKSSAVGLLIASAISLAVAVAIYLKNIMRERRSKKLLGKLLIVCIAFLFAAVPAFNAGADFGDYGGDYDYGGYDYDYGGNDYDYDYDDDYDYGHNDSYGGGTTTTSYYNYDYSTEIETAFFAYLILDAAQNVITPYALKTVEIPVSFGFQGFMMFICFVLMIVLPIIRNAILSKPHRRGPLPKGAERTDATSLRPADEYKTLDENFSLEEFKEKIAGMYCEFQRCWTEKDMKQLRPYLTDAFYAQCERQLDNYIRNNQTNIVKNIVVNSVDVTGWKQDGTNDIFIAELKTSINDYVVDDRTGETVRGSESAVKHMHYEWTLVRKTGEKTGAQHEQVVCPNCGAPLTLNAASECEYCGSVIASEASDWAVSGIKGLAQRTSNS